MNGKERKGHGPNASIEQLIMRHFPPVEIPYNEHLSHMNDANINQQKKKKSREPWNIILKGMILRRRKKKCLIDINRYMKTREGNLSKWRNIDRDVIFEAYGRRILTRINKTKCNMTKRTVINVTS